MRKCVFSIKYKQHAKVVLNNVIKIYGNVENYKNEIWGNELNAEEVLSICKGYIKKYKIKTKVFFGDPYQVVTLMTPQGLSLVATPGYYWDLHLVSLLDQYIGCYHLRSVNKKHLTVETKKQCKENRIGWLDACWEGLATICAHIHYEKCELMYYPALYYYAVCMAEEKNFNDTFCSLYKYCTDFDDCWAQTMRVKRGISGDKIGGFC